MLMFLINKFEFCVLILDVTFYPLLPYRQGATTLNLITLGITTLSITTLSVWKLGKKTFSIPIQITTTHNILRGFAEFGI
jgi:hypothetical protein